MKTLQFACLSICAGLSLASCTATQPGTASTPLSDAARASTSTLAQASLASSNVNTQNAVQIGNVANSLGALVLGGDVSGFDISGLPSPSASSAGAAGLKSVAQRLPAQRRAAWLSPQDTHFLGVRVEPDPGNPGKARQVQDSTVPNDSVLVFYANGDQASYEYNREVDGWTIRVTVSKGTYAGTVYATEFHTSEAAGLSYKVSGHLEHSGDTPIKAEVNRSFSLPPGQNHDSSDYQYDGDYTDDLALSRVSSHMRFSLSNTSAGGGSFKADWMGTAHFAKLSGSPGQFKEIETVDWQNFLISWDVTSLVTDYEVSVLAAGAVLYNGKIVGWLQAPAQIKNMHNPYGVQIRWDDGIITDVDFSRFFLF